MKIFPAKTVIKYLQQCIKASKSSEKFVLLQMFIATVAFGHQGKNSQMLKHFACSSIQIQKQKNIHGDKKTLVKFPKLSIILEHPFYGQHYTI